MHPPVIFCPTCGRSLGAAASCIFCGWERPAALRIPAVGQPLWQLDTAAPADGHPLLLGDLICLADRTGALAGLSLADGAVRWRWVGDGPLRGQLAGRSNRVYAARGEGGLLALTLPPDDSGAPSIAWRFPLPSSGAPALDEGRIYVGSGEGTIYALTDAGDRAEIAWQANVGGRVALVPVRWRHLLRVANSHAQGHLIALDAGRGTVVWSQPLGARAAVLLRAVAHRKTPRGAGAASAEDEVIVITDRGLARTFGLPDGEPSGWTFQVAGGAPVAAGDVRGALYLAGAGGQVVVLPATGGEPRQLASLNDAVIGLATSEDLLFAACPGGVLHVLDAADGAPVGQWLGGHPLTARLLIANGLVLVGEEAGWTALPWHLGQWRWAAAHYRAWSNVEAAAACHALAGELDAAEQTWLTAGTLERPAWLWTGLGEDRRAAAAFRHAADAERARHPALAAAYLNQAADRLEACEEPAEAAACRGLAGRMGRFPHLRLTMANLPAGEVGEPMTAAVEIRNVGNAPAEDIHFHLGGRLARRIEGNLHGALAPAASAILEFEGLIPTASGRERLTVSVTCGVTRAHASFEFDVAAAPPGAVTINGDAGGLILRLREGAPPPNVHVKGMAGMVKVEMV